MKRTPDYVLFKVNGGSAIINGKFVRKKENEHFIFLSVPPQYDVAIRYREYKDSKWQTTSEMHVKAEELAPMVKKYSQIILAEGDDTLPF